MRPLTHRFPQQSVGGQARAEKYTTFGKYFIDSFGHYCMACEAPLSTDMQVDHRLGSVLPHGFQTLKREEREKKEAEVDEMLGAENALLFRDSESFETAFMALCPKCNNCKNRGISPKDVVGTVKPLARPVQAAPLRREQWCPPAASGRRRTGPTRPG